MDSHRWYGSWLLVAFNDNFFMALLFFPSGLFAWPGSARKGAGKYSVTVSSGWDVQSR